MGHHEILADIHALEEDLLEFERQYGLRSETFFPAYMNGEGSEDDSWTLDFGEWASVYPAIPGEPRFNQTLTIDLRTSNSQAKNQPRPQQPPQTGTL